MNENREATIDFELPCGRCGASLRVTHWHTLCLKCGQDLEDTLFLPAIDQRTATIASDVPCVGCEYNLRTLHVSRRCPECGRPVIDSLSRKRLFFQKQTSLRAIRNGSMAILVPLVMPLVWLLMLGMEAFFGIGSSLAAAFSVLVLVAVLLGLPTGLVLLDSAKLCSCDVKPRVAFWCGGFLCLTFWMGVFCASGFGFCVWLAGLLLGLATFVTWWVRGIANAVGLRSLQKAAFACAAAWSIWSISIWIRLLLLCLIPRSGWELVGWGFPLIDLILMLICDVLGVSVFIRFWRNTQEALRLQKLFDAGHEAKAA